jgi:hypothetical protein
MNGAKAMHDHETCTDCESRVRAAVVAALQQAADAVAEGFDRDNEETVGEFSGDYNDGYVYAMELADKLIRARAASYVSDTNQE